MGGVHEGGGVRESVGIMEPGAAGMRARGVRVRCAGGAGGQGWRSESGGQRGGDGAGENHLDGAWRRKT